MWTVERACMMGMQKSDIYSERNRHCVSGCRVACSMFHAATRVLARVCRTLANSPIPGCPIGLFAIFIRCDIIADGTARRPAGGARQKDAARAPRTVTKNLAQRATTHQGRVRLTRLGLPPRRPPGPLSQHAPSRLGQSGHAAPRLTQLESPSHPAASAGPLTGPLHPFHVTRPNAGMCRVSRITCVGTSTVAAFQDSGTCDA